MVGGDPHTVEAARRLVQHVRRAAEQAERAAIHAASVAALQERLAESNSPEDLRDLHTRMAARSRRTAKSQHRAHRLLLDYARRLEGWAAGRDAATRLRPVLMSQVARASGWAGVVLTLRGQSGGEGLVAASNATARRVHEAQVALNEGPAVDAARGGVASARGEELERRWPRFSQEAGKLGVSAAAAVPLHIGPRRVVGSLSAVGPPAPPSPGDLAGLRTLAETIDASVLVAWDAALDPGQDMCSLEMFEHEDFQPTLHQAAGVLHQMGEARIDDAIALIRAHAFAEDRPVAEVAQDIVHQRVPPP